MEKSFADHDKRFFAYLIDIAPIVFILFMVFYFFFGFDDTLSAYFDNRNVPEFRKQFLIERNIIRNLSLLIWIIYGCIMDCSRFQGTFGKHLMKIKVSDMEGNPILLKQSLKRNFGKLLSVIPLFIGVFWIIFDKRHQGWHDKIAKTFVLNREFK